MQAHLAQFLQNNDPPSEAILVEAKSLLSEPLKELEEKEAEYQRLIQALDSLAQDRKVIQDSVDEYSTILSPVRRIPSDILHEIFYQCLPTHRNPIMSITEAPLLLTRVCRSWRSTALASHRIWAKLHIPILPMTIHSPYDPYPHDHQSSDLLLERSREATEKYFRTMRARRHLVDIWLSRAASCPLSISLTFILGAVQNLDDSDEGNVLGQLFNTILSFSEQLRNFEVTMPFEVFRVLQNKITLDMIPNIQELKINIPEPYTPEPDIAPRTIIFLQAPKLQSVSLYAGHLPPFNARTTPSTWENLTDLYFHYSITSPEVVEVLRRCQNLEYCKLVVSNSQDVFMGPEDVLPLRRLHSLCIQVGGLDMMAMVYRRIDAPNLVSFDYQKYHRPMYPVEMTVQTGSGLPSSPALSLLEKSTKLRQFSFHPRCLSAQDILFSFRFASHITHLVVGQRSHSRGLRDYGYWLGPGNFDLNLLMVDADDAASAEREVLLPNLEVFEAYMTINITDENLLRFILGRLPVPPRGESQDQTDTPVGSLKKVKVAFERQRNVDIEPEVYARAKEAGVEIDLELIYPPELPPSASKYVDISSPWYGLSPDGDRSWTYPELESESII